MIKVENSTIRKIRVGEQPIQKAILGTNTGPKIIFEDITAAPWGKYTDSRGVVHEQGTDEEIALALERHKNGIIDLFDDDKYPGWRIGRTRVVDLDRIPAKGITSLVGTVWYFKGRKDSPAVIDTDNLSYTDGKYNKGIPNYHNPTTDPSGNSVSYWKINFSYHDYQKNKKTGKKKKKWKGSFNGICRDDVSKSRSLCFIKKTNSSYVPTVVYYNYTKDSSTVGKWNKPTPNTGYSIYLYKKSKKYILSTYQKIKITGGEDATNPDLIKWLQKNATCASYSSSDLEWEVGETQPAQQIELVLAHRFKPDGYGYKEEEGIIASTGQKIKVVTPGAKNYCKGFTVSDTADSQSDGGEEDDDEKSSFVVMQKGVLKNPGFILVKTKKDSKGNVTEYGSNKWGSSVRKKWLNSAYYNALPETLRELLLPFSWSIGIGGKTDGIQEYSDDHIGLPLEVHVMENRQKSGSQEFANYHIWEYYMPNVKKFTTKVTYDPASPIKKDKDGTKMNWWTSSPYIKGDESYVCIDTSGGTDYYNSKRNEGISPFMII